MYMYISCFILCRFLNSSLTEVEKFVEVNTVKQAENKYLCPLSGKKFKGAEFVRKHIFNKHAAKVEEVKQEVSGCGCRRGK